MNLCWKCREWAETRGWEKSIPYHHCHHEPKEKEICKCCHYLNGDVIPKIYMPVGWNVCPVCERKL